MLLGVYEHLHIHLLDLHLNLEGIFDFTAEPQETVNF